jgi:two-component system, NarL family, nitrate/nitrite response regulator NarL
MAEANRRSHRTTVFVAEDHPVFRSALERIVRDAGYELAGASGDGREVLRRASELRPDILLLDLDLPSLPGQTVMRALETLGVESAVLVVSGTADREKAIATIRAGARGFVAKTSAPDDIATALACVARGDTYLPQALHNDLVAEVRRGAEAADTLSRREIEVIALTARGRRVEGVATELHVSRDTVKTHLRNAYAKLNVSSAPAAVAEAMRKGLVD